MVGTGKTGLNLWLAVNWAGLGPEDIESHWIIYIEYTTLFVL